MTPISKCPPGKAAGSVLKIEVKARHHATWIGGEIESTGLSYEDFDSFHVRTPAPEKRGRRMDTPPWVNDKNKLLDVLTRFYENRANVAADPTKSIQERLQHADAVWQSKMEKQSAVLDRLCHEFVELKKSGTDPKRLQALRIHIESLDSALMFARRGPGAVASVLYGYYRRNLNSSELAEELHMKPNAVRQLVFRLRFFAEHGRNNRGGAGHKDKQKPASDT
jgi:hypothetical protein